MSDSPMQTRIYVLDSGGLNVGRVRFTALRCSEASKKYRTSAKLMPEVASCSPRELFRHTAYAREDPSG